MTAIRHLGIFLCLVSYVSVMGMFTVATPESSKRLRVSIFHAENVPVVSIIEVRAIEHAKREGKARVRKAGMQQRPFSKFPPIPKSTYQQREETKEFKKRAPQQLYVSMVPTYSAYYRAASHYYSKNSYAALFIKKKKNS